MKVLSLFFALLLCLPACAQGDVQSYTLTPQQFAAGSATWTHTEQSGRIAAPHTFNAIFAYPPTAMTFSITPCPASGTCGATVNSTTGEAIVHGPWDHFNVALAFTGGVGPVRLVASGNYNPDSGLNSGGGGSSSGGATTYTGLVATRAVMPTGAGGGIYTSAMYRTFHTMRASIPANSLVPIYVTYNTATGTNNENNSFTNDETIKLSLEYPTTPCVATSVTGSLTITLYQCTGTAPVVGQFLFNADGTAAMYPLNTTITAVTGDNFNGYTVTTSQAAISNYHSSQLTFANITPCTWSGQASTHPAAPADLIPDACNKVAMNAGDNFYLRFHIIGNGTSTTNIASSIQRPTSSTVDQAYTAQAGNGTPDIDATAGGTVPSNNTQSVFYPAAITGPTTKPSVVLFGDSIGEGTQGADSVSDPNGYVGEMERIFAPAFAEANWSSWGTTPPSEAQFTNRFRLLKYMTHAVDEYGINALNVTTGPENSGAVISVRRTFNAMVGLPTIGLTLLPVTSSTDSSSAACTTPNQNGCWGTTAGQAIVKNVAAVNALIRTGQAGEFKILDGNMTMDPQQVNLWPVGPIFGQATGTTNYGTADGTHPHSSINDLIARVWASITTAIQR